MRKMHVRNLVPGMKLARPVIASDGVLLWADEALTVRGIRRLRLHGVDHVYIDPDGPRAADPEVQITDLKPVQIVPDNTRRKAVTQIRSTFNEALHKNKLGHSPEIEQTAREMVHHLTRHQQLIQSVTEIRSRDEYLMEHSVNVSALAIMTGACLGLSDEQLYALGIHGLMHDIGKIRVPSAILDKPGPLTDAEYAEVKKHTLYAKELLAHDPVAARVASQHHERYDGSGYPYGLVGEEIDLFAQIVGLVDVYDAMMVDRCYRRALPAREVIEMLAGSGNYHFNFRVVKAFVANIAPYPVGSVVRLSSGQSAVVVKVSDGFPLYPTVRLLTDKWDNPLREPREVDLFKKCRRVVITAVEDTLLPSG